MATYSVARMRLSFLSEQDKDWVMGRAIVARLGWAQAEGDSG